LAVVRGLCEQLNYHKFDIRAVTWQDRIGVRRFPLDALLINPFNSSLQLSTRAMGRLTPEEWRPIIASGLLYYKHRMRGMLKSVLPIMLLALLEPFVLLASFRLLGNSDQFAFVTNTVLRDFVIVLLFIMIGIAFVLFLHFEKGYYLKTDDQAGELLGKAALIASLTKLASIDQTATAGKRGFLRPSIQERISHLST